jgi:hypothetical protein
MDAETGQAGAGLGQRRQQTLEKQVGVGRRMDARGLHTDERVEKKTASPKPSAARKSTGGRCEGAEEHGRGCGGGRGRQRGSQQAEEEGYAEKAGQGAEREVDRPRGAAGGEEAQQGGAGDGGQQ